MKSNKCEISSTSRFNSKKVSAAVVAGLLLGAPVFATVETVAPSLGFSQHVAYASESDSIIQFKDENLKNAVLMEMKDKRLITRHAQDITESDALKVDVLNMRNKNIKSLEGLENFRNLGNLYLDNNQISDITPLMRLSQLFALSLNHNQISDITPLASAHLPRLWHLHLDNNQISDITPLAHLPKLKALHLACNRISDVTPLAGLQLNNIDLILNGNQISDLSSLKKLDFLCFESNGQTIVLRPKSFKVNLISEIRGFDDITCDPDENIVDGVLTHYKGMKNPYVVRVHGYKNYSATVSVDFSQIEKGAIINFKDENLKNAILSEMKKQNLIDQSAQNITEADALKVDVLNMVNKNITSIEGLENFKNLTSLNLSNNHISDLTPIASLPNRSKFNATNQTITLHPKLNKVDLTKEIKGYGNVKFKSDENIVDGILTHKEGMQNPYVVSAQDGNTYSATIKVDFPKSKKESEKTSSETQAEDISEGLETLLGEYDTVKGTDNYKNADDKLKQAYDTAIKDGQKVYDKLSSTPGQVKQATEQIKAALGKLNGDSKSKTTIQSLQQQLDTANGNITKLTGELEKAKQQGKADKSTIQSLTEQLQQTKNALEKLKGDKTLSDTQKQTEIDKLNTKITELGKQITQLTKDKGDLQTQLDTANGNITKLTGELEKAKQQGKADASTISNLNGQVSTLKDQLDKLKNDKTLSDTQKQTEINKLNDKITNLGKQIAQLTQENTSLKGQIATLQATISRLIEEANQCHVSDGAKAQELEKVKQQLTQAQSDLEKLKQEKTQSDTEKQKEIERLSTQVTQLNQEITKLKQQDPTSGSSSTEGTGSSASLDGDVSAPASTSALYRLYNPWTGEHLFTTDAHEVQTLTPLGWRYEGIVEQVSMQEGTAVYRLYNPNTGEHHYTTNLDEVARCVANGWVKEGIAFYSQGDQAVFSMYNPYAKSFYHHYTSDENEIAQMVKDGWKKEGVKWYCASVQPKNLIK